MTERKGQLTPYTMLAGLDEIEPSGMNPRRDFEHIDELADAIRATGGEPVNPMVVVKDGNRFRIVDGERRYLALKRIWKDEPDHVVSVLVFNQYTDAAEIVAMLASDQKDRLTRDELAYGYQTALKLDVPTSDIAMVSGADEASVRKARRAAAGLGKPVALDLMDLAKMADMSLSDSERERVMASERPSVTLKQIGWGREVAGENDRAREMCEERGIPFWPDGKAASAAQRASGEKWNRASVYSADGLPDRIEACGAVGVVAKGEKWGSFDVLYPVPEGEAERDRRLKRAREANSELSERMGEISSAMLDRLSAIEHKRGAVPFPAWMRPVRDFVWKLYGNLLEAELPNGVPDGLFAVLEDEPPSLALCARFIASLATRPMYLCYRLPIDRDEDLVHGAVLLARLAANGGVVEDEARVAVNSLIDELNALAEV